MYYNNIVRTETIGVMNKQAILAEEKRLGIRLLALRRQYNRLLRGGAKQVTVTSEKGQRNVTVDCAADSTATLDCLRQALGATAATAEIWTHNNIRVVDEQPALGPWMTTEQLLRMGKPHIHL